ncbi:Bidirectional sugar transporter N3 [Sesamum angolense]|uniref:Bidirectional sugar transporter SWEET n=2 Tax=Sesamum TaxID=4181 RepID=A0AAE2BS70_9LAMI|nr:Bidirectional sugar transporter N3 [Sesamum angolense]
MAAFSIHNPLVFTFGILGNLLTFLVFLAPGPTFYRIMKKKSTEEFQSVPYVVTLLSNMLWLYYAIILSNEIPLITVNSFGCFMEAIYISIYIAYAPYKPRMLTLTLLLVNFVGLGFILIFTNFIVKGAKRIEFLGWICATLLATMYIAPLGITKKVIETKSVEFMPISLSFAIVVSAAMWVCYGFLLKDLHIVVANTAGVIAGVVQIIVYMIYKGKADTQAKLPITHLNSNANPTSDLEIISAKEDNAVSNIQPKEGTPIDPPN